MHSRVQAPARLSRKLIRNVDEDGTIDDGDRLPVVRLLPLLVVDGYLSRHLVIP